MRPFVVTIFDEDMTCDHPFTCASQFIVVSTSVDSAARLVRKQRKDDGCSPAKEYGVYEIDATKETACEISFDDPKDDVETIIDLFSKGPTMVTLEP